MDKIYVFDLLYSIQIFMLANHYLSSLKSKTIVDSDNVRNGEVIDTIIHIENLEPCGLVIKRSEFDSTRENMKLKDEEEQILPVEFIDEIGTSNVLLNTSFNKVNTVMCDEIENKDEIIRFTELKKLPVYNPDNTIIGKVKDLVFMNQVLVEVELISEELDNIQFEESYPEGKLCGITINEIDVSQVDIHVKISDQEINRRINLSNDPSIYSSQISSESEKEQIDRFKMRRSYLFM